MSGTGRSAIFSLSGGLDPVQPGNGENAAHGQLVGADGTRDCFVHRITAAGATLTVTGPITHGERATMELPFGVSAAGSVVGDDPDSLAFRFDAPLDVVAALARCLAALPAERRQMPRIELRQRLCIRHGDQVDFAWTRNLSPAGLGIEIRAPLRVGEVVEITLDGLRPIAGEIRWTEHGQAGIAFAEEIGWQILMPWLRQVANRRPAVAQEPMAGSVSPLGAVKNAIKLDAATHVRSGSSWWNAQITSLSSALVEFESDTEFAPLCGLWLSLPQIGGWPIRVIECHGARHVAEFRLPLRPHEMARLSEAARPR